MARKMVGFQIDPSNELFKNINDVAGSLHGGNVSALIRAAVEKYVGDNSTNRFDEIEARLAALEAASLGSSPEFIPLGGDAGQGVKPITKHVDEVAALVNDLTGRGLTNEAMATDLGLRGYVNGRNKPLTKQNIIDFKRTNRGLLQSGHE